MNPLHITKCQALEPNNCRYHGQHRQSYSKIAKTKMEIAKATYLSLQDSPQKYAAYVEMRQAQINYYSTDEGLQELQQEITNTETSENQNIKTVLYRNSVNRRLKEQTLEPYATFNRQVIIELPPKNNTDGSLSNFQHEGIEYTILYSMGNEEIIVTKKDLSSGSQEEEIIGLAATSLAAVIKSTQWFNYHFNTKVMNQ